MPPRPALGQAKPDPRFNSPCSSDQAPVTYNGYRLLVTGHSSLYCEPVSAFCPATLEHLLTTFGFHPFKKPVSALSS